MEMFDVHGGEVKGEWGCETVVSMLRDHFGVITVNQGSASLRNFNFPSSSLY